MFRKLIALSLIGTQLSLVSALPAAQAAERVAFSEAALLETIVTLKGLGLAEKDFQAQMAGAIERYNSVAPAEGREQRLEAALVNLGILTRQQAARFSADSKAAQARLAGVEGSVEQQTAALQAQVELLSRISLNGAQFSSCGWGIGLTVGGVIAAVVGLALRQENPSCHLDYTRPYQCLQSDCGSYDPDYGSSNCYDYWDTCYPTVCDQPNYYPYRRAGNITLIAGGVAAAAGIVLLFAGDGC